MPGKMYPPPGLSDPLGQLMESGSILDQMLPLCLFVFCPKEGPVASDVTLPLLMLPMSTFSTDLC